MADQKPSIGRIVHVVEPVNDVHLPAVVTEVIDAEKGHVALTVFGRIGAPAVNEPFVGHDPEAFDPLTWHWPERG